jgi:hypothetical protein
MQRRQRVRPDYNDRFGWDPQPTLEHARAVYPAAQASDWLATDSPLPQALILIRQRLT